MTSGMLKKRQPVLTRPEPDGCVASLDISHALLWDPDRPLQIHPLFAVVEDPYSPMCDEEEDTPLPLFGNLRDIQATKTRYG